MANHRLFSTRVHALFLIPLLAACGGEEPAPRDDVPAGDHATFSGGPPGGMAIVLPDGEPDNLNPLTYSSSPAAAVTSLVFRRLARRDSTLSNYQPDLATSWELQPDSATLLVRLRPDARWHDGQPVTAEDVVFTIERQQSDEVASPRQADVAAVESARAVDPHTVEVRFSEPGPYAVNALLELMPVPRHLLENVTGDLRFAEFSRNPVGNGFFRFGSWERGQRLTLEANPDMPEGRAALDRVVLRFVPEINAAMSEMLAGQGDLLKIAPDQRQRVESARQVRLETAAQVRPAWIAWNTRTAPVNDVRVRQALLMGIDREAVVQGLLPEVGQVAWTPIPPRLDEHSEATRPLRHDPAAAARLLEEAGWRDADGDGIRERNGRPLRVTVDYNTADPLRGDVLVAIQSQLRRIGVDLAPNPLERATWVSRLRAGEFQGSFWGWGWGPGVMGPNAEAIFHSRSIPEPNFAAYSNPRVDALIDSVQVTFDPQRRQQLWAQIEQHVTNDAVYAPIYLDPELYVVHNRIRNAELRGIEWWEDVPYWYIPTDERLPRDRSR